MPCTTTTTTTTIPRFLLLLLLLTTCVHAQSCDDSQCDPDRPHWARQCVGEFLGSWYECKYGKVCTVTKGDPCVAPKHPISPIRPDQAIPDDATRMGQQQHQQPFMCPDGAQFCFPQLTSTPAQFPDPMHGPSQPQLIPHGFAGSRSTGELRHKVLQTYESGRDTVSYSPSFGQLASPPQQQPFFATFDQQHQHNPPTYGGNAGPSFLSATPMLSPIAQSQVPNHYYNPPVPFHDQAHVNQFGMHPGGSGTANWSPYQAAPMLSQSPPPLWQGGSSFEQPGLSTTPPSQSFPQPTPSGPRRMSRFFHGHGQRHKALMSGMVSQQ